MLTLLLGRDWTANRKEILSRIAADVREQKGGRILMVPELISHDTERRLAVVAGDTSSRFAQVLTFTRLARRICDIVGNAAEETLDNGGRVVAMAAATRQLHSRLKAYAAVETKPEFLADMVDAVDEFKRCCITPTDLRRASAETEGSLAQKLEELSLILESYDAICQQGKRDPRSQMTWVLEQLEDLDFAEKHVFYIDGFPDFTRQHMAVLEHLIAHSTQVTISLNCDQVEPWDPAFETAGRTARELLHVAAKLGVQVHIQMIAEREDALQPVRRSLFGGSSEKRLDNQQLRLYRAGSIHQECQTTAAQIRELVQQGARYRDMAVICPDPAAYFSVLRLVFGKYDIPLYFAGTEDILSSGAMSTVFNALEVAVNGFQQQDVLHYIRSAMSPLDPDQVDRLENYAIIWAIKGESWLREWTMHPRGLSAQWDDESKAYLAELNQLRAQVMDPLHRLQIGIRDAVRLDQMIHSLYEFLEAVRFAERMEIMAQSMDASGDNRSAQILNQLWEILLDALEQLYAVLGSTAWEKDAFMRLLRLLLSQYDVGTIPPVLDAVMAGPVSAMRCQQEKYLFVLGAEEGVLPSYAGSKGLLSDQEREELRGLGVPLTGGALDGLQAEYAEIYGVFCGAEDQISVYSHSGQPSFLYQRLLPIAGSECSCNSESTYADAYEVCGILARYHLKEAAEELNLSAQYQDVVQRTKYEIGMISAENIRCIYGNSLKLSASQVDRQAECRLSYFLKYGLRAQERKEASVDPAEFGTYVHAVLEETVRDIMDMGGFRAVDLDTTLSIAMDHSKKYASEHFGQLDSQRLEYLFRRNAQELEMVVQELWRELHQAKYEPAYFELQFDRDGQMPAIDIPASSMPAKLRGFVDRVDTWQQEGCTFVRVVDYKTGKKAFDYCDVFNGVGLQMLLYLFALEDAGGELISGNRVSAGVQYFPARAPYLSVDGALSAEEAEQERIKLWKRSGLLLNNEDSLSAMDPTEKMDTLCCTRKKDGTISGDVANRIQLGMLKNYVMKLLRDMVEDIASGRVEANPYTRGTSHNACSFCPYGAICRKETVLGRRNYKTMTAQRFWEEMGKESDDG